MSRAVESHASGPGPETLPPEHQMIVSKTEWRMLIDHRNQLQAANRRLREGLKRCVKTAKSGHWRDKTGVSIEMHPAFQAAIAALKDNGLGEDGGAS